MQMEYEMEYKKREQLRDKIVAFSLQLNNQTDIPLWSIANESVIYCAAINKPHQWSKKKGKIFFMMDKAWRIYHGISDLIIFLFGMFTIIRIWSILKKKSFLKRKDNVRIYSVFAGFGASSEEELYDAFKKEHGDKFLRINWVTHENGEKLGCPKLSVMLLLLIKYAFGHTTRLVNYHVLKQYRTDFLTVCALNIGCYVFYQSYWRMAKVRGIQSVTFVAPDIPLHACVDAGVYTKFVQHGLLDSTVLIPKINSVELLTQDEEHYFRKNLQFGEIYRKSFAKILDAPKKDILFILSPEAFLRDRKKYLNAIIEWAQQENLTVVLRPRPNALDTELNELIKSYPFITLDDFKRPLNASLEILYPKFVFSWTSTGLATSLEYGLLPISFCDPIHGEETDLNLSQLHTWHTIIYPMYKRVLFWTRDEHIIKSALQSDSIYNSSIMALRNA